MLKLKFTLILVTLLALMLPGCKSAGNAKETTASTLFTGMLGLVPYAFFEKCDIQYGNFGQARQLHGAVEVNNPEKLMQLTKDEKWALSEALGETPNVFPSWGGHDERVAELTGFSIFSFDRVIFISSGPPRETWIALGNFNEVLIEGKLNALGYSKTNYGKHSYFKIRDDFNVDLKNPLSQFVLGGMNRVAVLDNMLIISPVTADVTAILDTMEGKTPSIMSNTVCKSLVENLGEPLAAALTTPERIIYTLGKPVSLPFAFSISASWGPLHGYEAAGLGYSARGEKKYFDIALYYRGKSDAEADGQEIIKRMNSYSLSLIQQSGSVPFTDIFKPGEPAIKKTGEGTVLGISCEVLKKQKWGMALQIGGGNGMPVRDILFLTSEPEKYIAGK
jgi:hypothetical protein